MSNQLQVSGEAKIRAIQGPVVANSGVITALDGDASEYVRGDGTLADFPTSTGGGSSVSYYLNTSVSQGTIGGVAYKQLSKVPISGAGTDVTISANGYIASYITDANDPALLEVPAGNFNCEFYFSVNSNAHNPYVYAEVYKYDGTTFTLLGSNVSIPQYLSNGTTLSPYYFAIAVSTAVLTVTDRIAIRIYVNVDGRTVTLHTENNHLCQVVTTFSKGLISLNNLTRQNQFFATGTSGTDFAISSATATHTFNLPVASASNTGKLSSTDWSTFNNKQNLLTNPVTGTGSDGRVAFWTGASTLSSDANLYYDYSTDRLGIGTNTPNASLGILNSSSTGIQVRTSDSANQYQANIFYDASYGMVYGYNRLGTGTASNLTFFNNIGGFLSIPESSNNNIGFNTINPQGSSATTVYDFTSTSTNVEIRLHNPTTGYTSTDGSYIKVTPTVLAIGNDESSKEILINNGGNNVIRITGTNKVGIGDFGSITPTEQLSVEGSIMQTGIVSTMVKVNSVGKFIAAIAGTDYLAVGSAVTSVTATSPILSSGGTTPNISIPAATTSVSGYLTSTDWTTFNNKFTLPALTQGSILFYDGSNVAQNNSKLYWDNNNMRLGIGTQSVTQYVTYIQANTATNANAWVAIDNPNTTGSTALRLILNGATTSGFQYVQSTNMTQIFANQGDIQLINSSSLGLTIAYTTGNATFSASATATSFVKSGGTSSQFLKADGSIDSTAYGTGTVTSVATSAPLTGGTITTSGTIGITQATTSTNGYLSSTDWNTFNGKFTLPSLTSGSVLFSNGSTITQNNSNFYWNNVNIRLGIGTNTPETALHIISTGATLIIDGNNGNGVTPTDQTNATLRLRTGGFTVGNFMYKLSTDNIEISNVSGGGVVTSGGVKIFGTGGSTTGLTIAAAGEATFSQKIQISAGGLRIGTSATENDRLIVVNGTNLTTGSTQYLEVIAPTYTGNITNLYGRLQYATCNSGTITNAYMMYLGSWSGTSTYSNKWSIYQESTTEKNYFGSTVLIGSATDNGLGKLQVTGAATFSSSVSATSATFSDRLNVTKAVSENIIIANYDINNRMEMSANGFNLVGGNPFYIRQASGANQFTIHQTTGAATFSSSVNIASTTTIGGIDGSFLRTYSATNDALRWAFINSSSGVFSIQQQGDGYANQGDRLVINRSGNVGIGTNLPNFKAHISTGSTTSITQPTAETYGLYIQQNTSGSTGGLYIQDGASNSGNSIFVGDNNGAARFVVNTDGNIEINNSLSVGATIVSNIRLYVKGGDTTSSNFAIAAQNSSGFDLFAVRNDGNINTGTRASSPYNNTFVATANMYVNTDGAIGRAVASSLRFKENIQDWDGKGLDTILALKPKTFTYKADYYKNPDLVMLGLIAEEVAEVSPYLADYDNDDRSNQVENVRYANIVVPLIKAVQELKAEIEELKALINK